MPNESTILDWAFKKSREVAHSIKRSPDLSSGHREPLQSEGFRNSIQVSGAWFSEKSVELFLYVRCRGVGEDRAWNSGNAHIVFLLFENLPAPQLVEAMPILQKLRRGIMACFAENWKERERTLASWGPILELSDTMAARHSAAGPSSR